MLILSSTRQRSRICDRRRSERRYFDVVRRHINAVQRRINVNVRRRNDVI